MADVHRLGVGGFMTEFGGVDNSTSSISAITFLVEFADSNFQSWTYWQFKLFQDITTSGDGESFYDANGKLMSAKVRALSRTYAQAIAGTPNQMKFNPANSHFKLVFEMNKSIKLPTEIYLNEAWYYQNGYVVSITPANVAKWTTPERNKVYIFPLSSAPSRVNVTVTIYPK